jgi:intracellular sulfur oxidation DsrE/DsrF family protein
LFIFCFILSFICGVDAAEFNDGPLIKGYGKHAKVKQELVLDTNVKLKVVFDVSNKAKEGKVNNNFNSLARFFNMHVANGFAAKNIELALVVHGKAGFDLLANKVFQAKYGQENPSRELLSLLLKKKVKIYLCGQSAAYLEINNTDLYQGVQMSLSAMTAHAVLQHQGYTLNPF